MKSMSRNVKRWVAQIACLALLLSSFAPSIASAMSVGTHDGWTEVCSVVGEKWIQTADNSVTSSPAESGTHLSHCPFCLTHANAVALPSTLHIAIPLAISEASQPALFYLAPRPLFAWASPEPRAPPLFS